MDISNSKQSYSPVSNDTDSEKTSLNDEAEFFLGGHATPSLKKKRVVKIGYLSQRKFLVLNLGLLLTNIIIVVFSVLHSPNLVFRNTPGYLPLKPAPPGTPALTAIEYHLVQFEIDSRYVQEPSPEVDAAWDELDDGGASLALSAEAFALVNYSPETGVKVPNDTEGRYVASIDSAHQIHCVDIVRRGLFFNIDYYRTGRFFASQTDEEMKKHITHCIDTLRQVVMCHGDPALLTYNWVEGFDDPQSHWGSWHTCQNWDVLQKWRRAHNITGQLSKLYRPVIHHDA